MNEDICVPDSLEATAADLAVPYKGGVKGRGHDSKSSKQRRFSRTLILSQHHCSFLGYDHCLNIGSLSTLRILIIKPF